MASEKEAGKGQDLKKKLWQQEANIKSAEKNSKPSLSSDRTDLGPGIDLEVENEVVVTAPEPALYETAYVTSHKGNCRAGSNVIKLFTSPINDYFYKLKLLSLTGLSTLV